MSSSEIDNRIWQDVKESLETARNIINRNNRLKEEVKIKILKERAAQLAKLPQEKIRVKKRIKLMKFIIGKEQYAIEPIYIREVYPLLGLTNIPCTPDYVLGVINLRGQIISVLDIKKFFEIPDSGITDLSKVIVLKDRNMELGILADKIIGVERVLEENIQTSLPTLTDIREEYLKGITNERVVILDGKKLLSSEKIIINEEVQ